MHLGGGDVEGARGGPDDQQAVAAVDLAGFYEKLADAQAREVFQALAHILLMLRSRRPIRGAPFAQALPQVVAVPEAAVEHAAEALVPSLDLLGRESAVGHGGEGFLVAAHHGIDIFGRAGAPLYLEHADAGLHHAVQEADGLEVLRTHDILVVHVQFDARLAVAHGITAAAHLHTLAAVGRVAQVVEREVALAADGHAQGAVAEHLDAHGAAGGSAEVFADDAAVDLRHLVQVEFARQHHDVGIAGIEAQGLGVGDVELGGEVHLLPDVVAVGQDGHVGGDDGRDAGGPGGVADAAHQGQVVLVDDGVDGEVTLHPRCLTAGDDVGQVGHGEAAGGVGPHVEGFDAEIDGVGTGLYGGGQGLA